MTPPTAKQTKGPIHGVPCPHCGHKADFRQLRATGGDVFGVGEQVSCDRCKLVSIITLVQEVTVIALRQVGGRRPEDATAPPAPPPRRQAAPATRQPLPQARALVRRPPR